SINAERALEINCGQSWCRWHHSRRQERELIVVASVQREFHDLLSIDYRTARGCFGFQKRRCGADMDDFFKRTEVKAYVDAGNLVYLENDALLNKLLKAFQFGGDGVVAWIEGRQDIAPDLIRLRDLASVPVSVRN